MTENDEQKITSDTISKAVEISSVFKALGGWMFGVVMVVISIIFWIQSQGTDKYYPKLAGENLERQVLRIEQKFDNLEAGNREIIRLLGRLEASQENRGDDNRQ